MFLPPRSLPGGISTTGVPPVDTTTEDASTMAKKTPSQPVLLPVLIPVAIALGIYLVLFHVLLPTWRAHRERYRQYLPLHASERITSRLPHILQPSTISSGISSLALRIFFPTTYALRQTSHAASTSNHAAGGTTTYRASSTDGDGDSDSDTPLFTAESGEAMVGFDVPHANSDPRDLARRRRENLDRFAGRNLAYARAMENNNNNNNDDNENNENNGNTRVGLTASRPHNDIHPERRLSRELEAGFRDDSDEEDEEEDDGRGVTVGRRSFSASR